MTHAFAVFLIWLMSLFGVSNCEPVRGVSVGICIETSAPAPPPPAAVAVPNTRAISNGF